MLDRAKPDGRTIATDEHPVASPARLEMQYTQA